MKTTTVEVKIGDLAEVKALVAQLERDKAELLDTLASNPHTVAAWINDARFEYAEGWAGSLDAEPDSTATPGLGHCRAGHYCCDGYLVSRRVMEMIVEHNRHTPGEFEISNESTVFPADVEAIGFEQGRVSDEADEALFDAHDKGSARYE